jgi:hypothetical protein
VLKGIGRINVEIGVKMTNRRPTRGPKTDFLTDQRASIKGFADEQAAEAVALARLDCTPEQASGCETSMYVYCVCMPAALLQVGPMPFHSEFRPET